jgi:hypothetical protein
MLSLDLHPRLSLRISAPRKATAASGVTCMRPFMVTKDPKPDHWTILTPQSMRQASEWTVSLYPCLGNPDGASLLPEAYPQFVGSRA